jgi:hypothetical protein
MWPEARRTGNGTPDGRPRRPGRRRRRPPRTPAPEAEGGEADEAAPASAQADAGRDFTKLPMARLKGSSELEGGPNRRRPRESPRGRAGRETAKGSRPRRGPKGAGSRGFGLLDGLLVNGKAFGRRRDPKGFREASAWRNLAEGERLRPGAFRNGQPERLRPRCEPEERARLRLGPIREGKRWRGFDPDRATRGNR